MSGRVVHFEMPFEDSDRAAAFYRDVFEWDVTPVPEMQYTIVSTGPTGDFGPKESGFVNGGMLRRQPPIGSPVLIMAVDDIDATITQIEESGGTMVTEKQAAGEIGFSAYFQDPEGNVMGIWQNNAG